MSLTFSRPPDVSKRSEQPGAHPSGSGHKAGYTLNGVPMHCRAHKHTFTYIYTTAKYLPCTVCLWTVGGDRTRRKSTQY